MDTTEPKPQEPAPPIKARRKSLVRIALWALPILLVVFIASFIYLRIWLNGYLQSDSFRLLLGRMTSKQLSAKCEYQPFHFSGLQIHNESFKAQGTARAAFSDLQLDNISVAINLHGLWNKAVEVDDVTVDKLRVSLGHTASPPVPDNEIEAIPENPKEPPSSHSNFPSPKLDLRVVTIKSTDILWGEKTPQAGAVTGTIITVKPDGDAWNIVLKSGTISQKGGPDLQLDHINVHYADPVVTIPEGLLNFPPGGNIALSGTINPQKFLNVLVKMNGLPLKPFLPPDSQSKLHGGTIFADINVSGTMPVTAAPDVSGSGRLEGADLEGIPALDFIAKFTRSPQFHRIKLNKASADFLYSGQKVTISNLDIESNGLMAIQGKFVINNSQINGTFEIGVPHDLVKWLPGLEEKVFSAGRGQYRWATMHLSGPLNSPKEDLSHRIEIALATAPVSLVVDAVKEVPKVPEAPKKLLNGLLSPLKK